jgi:hypothetical protein
MIIGFVIAHVALIAALEALRHRDLQVVHTGIPELARYTNGVHLCDAGDIPSIAHNLLQLCGQEASLDFEFLAASTAVTGFEDLLCRFNNFLTADMAQSVSTTTVLIMMVTNRVALTNLVLSQARSVHKLLFALYKSMTSPTVDAQLAQQQMRIKKELLSMADSLAAVMASKRHYATKRHDLGGVMVDPRFMLFEFGHGLILRQSQVELVRKLLGDMEAGQSVCHQMIMGAGKTTVVGPLLAMCLASASTMVMEVVPPALLDFSAGVLRERFSTSVRKPVFTFLFDRYNTVTPQLVSKLKTARQMRSVVVTSPQCVKSFMLKFIETMHILNKQKHLSEERKIIPVKSSLQKRIRKFLGFSKTKQVTGALSHVELLSLKNQAALCEEIFQIFRSSVEIMDEVDIILHPLKSELNWPLGLKEPLDFTRSRYADCLREFMKCFICLYV